MKILKLILKKWNKIEETRGEKEEYSSNRLREEVFSKKEFKFLEGSINPLFNSDGPCP